MQTVHKMLQISEEKWEAGANELLIMHNGPAASAREKKQGMVKAAPRSFLVNKLLS